MLSRKTASNNPLLIFSKKNQKDPYLLCAQQSKKYHPTYVLLQNKPTNRTVNNLRVQKDNLDNVRSRKTAFAKIHKTAIDPPSTQ
ncbi:unknown protein [Desulfotalea psychrophila LSv54]|uniref:Uncharacterized protein n=1 Tax=Desulfotalea psychrophila (strain LSv54 / DSM 12343) TaxID=177439 RepID=Q6AI82_DESPS|nr:unknown protein [Desulfotalea psychrophila LSv54]